MQPSRNQGLLQMAWWHIKAFTPLTGKYRAKGPQPLKVFLIQIIPRVTSSGSPMILRVMPCNLEGALGLFGQVPRSTLTWALVSMRM